MTLYPPEPWHRVEALDQELVELARRHDVGGGAMDWEFLIVTARRS
jgi:hypothetical protein